MKWAAALLALSCGPEAALFVTIEAPLRVPDQCDAVFVSAAEHDELLFSNTYALSTQFPQTLTLESTARTQVGGDVTVTVTAQKDGGPATAWATATATATLESGKLTPVTVRICECP